MRSRYYNPQIKRFINQDVLIGSIGNSNSLNRYSYVEGNPVSYTDPFGLSPYGNFGTFLNVMNLLSNIDLSNVDKKLLRHAILDIIGILPGGWIADVANALLYFKERNPIEGWKSLFYAIPGTDLAAKASKYAAKFGKLSDQVELLLKSLDFIGHVGAMMFSAADFGKDIANMIDKYMVGEAEFSVQTVVELISLGGHGLQLSSYTRLFLDNLASGVYDSVFEALGKLDINLKSILGLGTDWDIRYNNQGGATLPFGPRGGTPSGRTFKSQYEIPTNEKGYTKSSLELGNKVHKEYMSDVADDVNKIKEYVLPSGKRVDFIDFENKIVYELKPNNPIQIRKGTKQLAGYLEEIETVFGNGWSSVLDTY